MEETGNETVNGIKTFGSFPVTPSSAPTTDYQVANKKYVDDSAGASTPTVKFYSELAVAARQTEVLGGSATLTQGATGIGWAILGLLIIW